MKEHPFGEKLRNVRERRQMTLKEVARQAGVSESLISQIERDKVSPSIDTLLNITDILGIHPEYLFRGMEPAEEITVTRANEGALLIDGFATYRSLCSRHEEDRSHSGARRGTEEDKNRSIEVFRLELEPGGSHGAPDYGHRGYEIGVILEGKAVLFYGEKRIEVSPGDCVSFASNIPHTLQNPGPDKLISLWYVSPERIFKP